MAAIRIPFALVSGLLLSLAVFLALFSFVNRAFDGTPPQKARVIEFTRIVPDTPVESTRDKRIERPPPAVIPDTTGLPTIGTPIDATPVRVERPQVEIGGRNRTMPVGSDRDVLPIVRFAPEYPARALANGTEGWVQVRFTITPTGTVRDAVVVESEPGAVFDDAALKAISRWRYNPRIDGGEAVERVGMQTVIRFTLND